MCAQGEKHDLRKISWSNNNRSYARYLPFSAESGLKVKRVGRDTISIHYKPQIKKDMFHE